jgi:hypothetical protein
MMIEIDTLRQAFETAPDAQLCLFQWLVALSQGAATVGKKALAGAKIAATTGAEAVATGAEAVAGAAEAAAEATPSPTELALPPAVREMLKPEAVAPVSQAPTVDLGANLSTPTGPARVSESFPTVPRGTDTPPEPSLMDRLEQGVSVINEGLEKTNAFLDDPLGLKDPGKKPSEATQLFQNLRELGARVGSSQARRPNLPPGETSPEPIVETPAPSPIPQLAQAQTVPLRGQSAGGLGLSGRGGSFATSRPEAIAELLAELRLNRRSFG